MNNQKLQSAIAAFVKNKKANAAYYDDSERCHCAAHFSGFRGKQLKKSNNAI